MRLATYGTGYIITRGLGFVNRFFARVSIDGEQENS